MMTSPSIYDDTRLSCWLSAGSAHTRVALLECPAIAPANSARNAHDARSPLHAHPRFDRGQIPIEIVAPPLLHFPRFRALALFGRRPHEHVVRTSMPASENLHRFGRPAMSVACPLSFRKLP